MIASRALVLILALIWSVALVLSTASAQTMVHGAQARFSDPTLKLAWAIEKGASESQSMIVIRVINVTGAYRFIRLDGVDPFSKARTTLIPHRPLAARTDLKLLRASLAEFPSVEIQLFASEPASAGEVPKLTVFYLGVPDTAPEFPNGRGMESYFASVLQSAP